MAFELTTMTTVRVLDVRTLASKDRKPDEPPGAQLLLQADLPIAALAMFDSRLPEVLARKAPAEGKKQGQLAGIEQLELTEIGSHVKRMPWAYDQTGCTIEIDRGLGGSSNLKLHDCTVHRVSFAPQKGVSARVWWTVDAPGQTDAVRGKLTGMKATEMPITQVGPAVDAQQDLASPSPAPRKTTANTPGAAGMEPTQAWPFPGGKNSSGGQRPPQDATDAVLADVAKNGPGHSANPKPKAAAKTKRDAPRALATPPAKYRDPQTGQTWSGRGLKPRWLTVALERGKKLGDFEIKGH